MKLIRIGPVGQEIPGVLCDQNGPLNVSAFGEDYNEAFFATDGPARLRDWLEGQGTLPRFSGHLRYGSPIARPSKIICVGLNYADHARGIRCPFAGGAGAVFQVHFGALRCQRQRHHPLRLAENRLGGRAGLCHWQGGAARA